jgi:GT2 family glycosyltransferase
MLAQAKAAPSPCLDERMPACARQSILSTVSSRGDRPRAALHHIATADLQWRLLHETPAERATPLAQDGAIRARASHPIKVADLELCGPITGLTELGGYESARLLVRLDGAPLGWTTVPVVDGHCDAHTLIAAVGRDLLEPLVREAVQRRLQEPLTDDALKIPNLLAFEPSRNEHAVPSVTVAVCTRNRPSDLALCLDAIAQMRLPASEVLVVDNAPSSDATERLVREHYPGVRYVLEPRPGLDWARNRAIAEAQSEIIAFTDDDVIVDRGWVAAIAELFASAPDVHVVTGLVVPYELESEAQQDFESYGGFGRGLVRTWHVAGGHHGAGRFGTGANMAFRRALFDRIGGFDPALDVGTAADGGGDLEMYFRVLQEGYMLVFEPRAVVRHRHRRETERLRKQMRDWGKGLFVYVRRSADRYPRERPEFRRLTSWWIRRYIIRRYLLTFLRYTAYPRDLIAQEVRGALQSRRAYREAVRSAERIARESGTGRYDALNRVSAGPSSRPAPTEAVAVRTIELAARLAAINDVESARAVQLYLLKDGRPVGSFEIATGGHPLSVPQLRDGLADFFLPQLLRHKREEIGAEIARWFEGGGGAASRAAAPASPDLDATSIVVATFDRPDDLRACLRSLASQTTRRDTEIIVVDNHPASGLTPPVVAEFPRARLLDEPRQGLSYARNAGIAASSGPIIVATDDDVVMPPDWLEKLLAPFARDDVMIVTGNVLPAELATRAQQLFEHYGGLGRGFVRVEAGGEWFGSWYREAVPTWQLGATANAAFRATIFSHPRIGLLDPALGAGTPTGCSEDTDLFYRVLAAGFTVVYEPAAYVWHHHRSDMRALRRQIYAYSKGHVAYHLKTWRRYGDTRALFHLALTLPRWQIKKLVRWMRRSNDYPLSLILTEIAGNFAGPWALWRAQRRARRLDAARVRTP